MSTATQAPEKIVFCQCAYTRILPKKVKEEVRDDLDRSGVEYEQVPDLCRLAAERDPKLAELAEEQNLKIAACFPRAVKWLFHAGGSPLDDQKAKIYNMREQPAAEVSEGILGEAKPAPIEGHEPQPWEFKKPEEPWKPWFPVIDFDRCTNCMQCLSFCLFDVYGVSDDKQIQVKNPTKCKTDCPACSRVCPEAAILFPKYKSGPINGAEVSEADLEREKMKVDITALLGGDIYGLLRERRAKAKSRFSKERDEERAITERKRCLKKLQENLDIPEELMAALPSPDIIREKAEAMFERATQGRRARREAQENGQ